VELMADSIEMSYGVVVWVGPKNHVLDVSAYVFFVIASVVLSVLS